MKSKIAKVGLLLVTLVLALSLVPGCGGGTEEAAPVVDFSANPTSGGVSLTVSFTDQSVNSPTSWEWDFNNDGTVDSTEQNPTYTYEAAGTYTVKLTAVNAEGSGAETKTDYIIVEPTALTIVNGDTTQELTLSEIEEMTAVEGWGGRLKSDGVTVEGPYKYKGVSLVNLCDLVGGIDPSNSVKITAEDGYSMTFSYNQATASDGFTFFNAADPTEEISAPASYHVILAYEESSEPLPTPYGGPLRVCIVDSENQLTEGHWWIKWVTKIEVQTGEEAWTLHLEGAINEDMDNGSFGSGVNCHGVSYTDDKGEWTGIPLWYLVGRVDDGTSHGEGAFNDDLANSGAYTVKVIAKDGFSYTFDSATVAHNDDIIVANEKDGYALGQKKWPLCLRGSGLTSGKMKVGQIDTIQLIFS